MKESTYKQLIVWFLTCIIASGCHPDAEDPDTALIVTPTEFTFSATDVSRQSIRLQSNATWSLTIDEQDTWITTNQQQGHAGTHTITIHTAENPDYGPRTGRLQIRDGPKTYQQITIHQQGRVVPEDQPELKALVAWYNATDGPQWKNNDNWLSNKPL